MSHETPIYRTTPARTAKMMAIMCGVCIAGGALFFAFWDYWISMPPGNQVAIHGQETGTGTATGKTIPVKLNFVESSDFKTLAFNALPGEEGHNPPIEASVGDKIEFTVTNNGVSFHAFGVTKAESGFEGTISSSAIGSMNSPLKAGQSGSSSFVPSEEGTYYYICTIPGHRDLGMVGEIKVGPKGEAPKASAPTGVKQNFDLNFVESSDFKILAFNALPGEDGHNPEIKVHSGDSVTIKSANNGISFHSFGVVSNPDDVSTVVFNAAIGSMNSPIKPKEAKEVTFTAGAPGSYYYICTVPGHASLGMKGNFIVE